MPFHQMGHSRGNPIRVPLAKGWHALRDGGNGSLKESEPSAPGGFPLNARSGSVRIVKDHLINNPVIDWAIIGPRRDGAGSANGPNDLRNQGDISPSSLMRVRSGACKQASARDGDRCSATREIGGGNPARRIRSSEGRARFGGRMKRGGSGCGRFGSGPRVQAESHCNHGGSHGAQRQSPQIPARMVGLAARLR